MPKPPAPRPSSSTAGPKKPAPAPAKAPASPPGPPPRATKKAHGRGGKPVGPAQTPKKDRSFDPIPHAKSAPKKAPPKKPAPRTAPRAAATSTTTKPASPPKKRPVSEIQFAAEDETLLRDDEEDDDLDGDEGLGSPRARGDDGDGDDFDGDIGGPMVIDMPAAAAEGRVRKPKRKPMNHQGPQRCGTVALVGRPNVGKSSLLNALLGQKIAATTHKPQTTRRALRGVLTEGNTQLVFVDTPGLHEEQGGLFTFMLDEALDAAVQTNVLCFLVEADRKRGGIIKADEEALKRLMTRAPTTPVVLVISKIDVLEDKAVLLPLLQEWAAAGKFAGYIPLSAHKQENLEGLLDELAKLMPEAPFVFPADSITDQSERDIAAELIREKVMLELQQEIPYRTAVLVEHFDESRRDDDRKPLVHIAGVIVVEKDSQKSMVIGKGGQRIKQIGQRARKDLEHLLMCQVHLELFVKVEKDWTQTGVGLRKLGYTRTN
ncbi:MAG TPA: GTPase Era [Myxococcota bacterium]